MNEYIIIGAAVDFGVGKDGKAWTGLRLVAQEQSKDGKAAYTSIFKCGVPLDKLPTTGTRCLLLFDRFGRVTECRPVK